MMSFNHLMHPRNPYKDKPPDFKQLAIAFPEFRQHCTYDSSGKISVNFRSDDAVRALTRATLLQDFRLDVKLPKGTLVPRIPQKLNYLLWIEDLLNLNKLDKDVSGLDIGTGASCIYSLLGARMFGWRFVGTDSDNDSLRDAAENVIKNEIADQVTIFRVEKDEIIKAVVRGYSHVDFTFTMCNPPFFEEEESDMKFVYTASQGGFTNQIDDPMEMRAPPRSITVAKKNELAVEGGEISFVNRIIDDSVILQSAVKIYTTMIGKKTSVDVIRRRLSRLVGARYTVSTLNQGKTRRWVVGWTFCRDIVLEQKSSSTPLGCLDIPESFGNGMDWLKEQFADLLIHTVQKDDGILRCEARLNTWTRARKRKRLYEQSALSCPPSAKKARLCLVDATTQSCLGEGDGRDSLTDAGNFNECSSHSIGDEKTDCAIQAYFPCDSGRSFEVRFHIQPMVSSTSPSLHNSFGFVYHDGSKQSLQHILQYLRNKFK